jgi:hypothetical protein
MGLARRIQAYRRRKLEEHLQELEEMIAVLSSLSNPSPLDEMLLADCQEHRAWTLDRLRQISKNRIF